MKALDPCTALVKAVDAYLAAQHRLFLRGGPHGRMVAQVTIALPEHTALQRALTTYRLARPRKSRTSA